MTPTETRSFAPAVITEAEDVISEALPELPGEYAVIADGVASRPEQYEDPTFAGQVADYIRQRGARLAERIAAET